MLCQLLACSASLRGQGGDHRGSCIALRSKHCLDLGLEGERVVSRAKVVDDLALLVDEELAEVPLDDLGLMLFAVIEGALAAQELVDWVRVAPIHIDLREHGEVNVVLFLCPCFDLGLGARLLVHELIAGEGEDLEAACS